MVPIPHGRKHLPACRGTEESEAEFRSSWAEASPWRRGKGGISVAEDQADVSTSDGFAFRSSGRKHHPASVAAMGASPRMVPSWQASTRPELLGGIGSFRSWRKHSPGRAAQINRLGTASRPHGRKHLPGRHLSTVGKDTRFRPKNVPLHPCGAPIDAESSCFMGVLPHSLAAIVIRCSPIALSGVSHAGLTF